MGFSPDPSLYCPNDTLVYTCESSRVTSGPDFLGWNINFEFARILYFQRSGGVPPLLGSTMIDPNTGAVVELTVVEADHWICTLTITHPGSSFTNNPVNLVCADNTASDTRTLSALGELHNTSQVFA